MGETACEERDDVAAIRGDVAKRSTPAPVIMHLGKRVASETLHSFTVVYCPSLIGWDFKFRRYVYMRTGERGIERL